MNNSINVSENVVNQGATYKNSNLKNVEQTPQQDQNKNANLNNNAFYFPYAQQFVNTDPTNKNNSNLKEMQKGNSCIHQQNQAQSPRSQQINKNYLSNQNHEKFNSNHSESNSFSIGNSPATYGSEFMFRRNLKTQQQNNNISQFNQQQQQQSPEILKNQYQKLQQQNVIAQSQDRKMRHLQQQQQQQQSFNDSSPNNYYQTTTDDGTPTPMKLNNNLRSSFNKNHRINVIDENKMLKAQNEYSELGLQQNKYITANVNNHLVNSPTSTPLVIAMGRLHQQSSMQMRKFDRIQGTFQQNNTTDISPIKQLQRESNSMIVNPKKQKLLQKFNMVGFDTNKDQIIINKTSNKSTIKHDEYFMKNCHSKLPDSLQHIFEDKNNNNNNNNTWNQNLQKRNQMSMNIYNHRTNTAQTYKNNMNNISQYGTKPLQQIAKEYQLKKSIQQENNREMLPSIISNKNSSLNLKNIEKQSSLNNNNNNYDNSSKSPVNIQQRHFQQSKNSSFVNKNQDRYLKDKKHNSLTSTINQKSREHLNINNYSQNINDNEINQSIKVGGRLIQPPINSQIVQENNKNLNRSVVETRKNTDLRENSFNQTKHINNSFINNTNKQTSYTSTQIPNSLNQTQLTKSQFSQMKRKSFFNMQIDAQKLEQLEQDDLPIEKRQEIIYNILKKQLDKQRKEILAYKKMKREIEKAKIAISENKIISDKEMARIKYQQEKLNAMSPEMIRIIENLTQKRRHNKYCKCCKYDIDDGDNLNHKSLEYDPGQMQKYLSKIRNLNEKLYGGKSMKNLGQNPNQEKISLRELAYKESRNDGNNFHSNNLGNGSNFDNSFVNMGSQNHKHNQSSISKHLKKPSQTQQNFNKFGSNNNNRNNFSNNPLQKTAGFHAMNSPDAVSNFSYKKSQLSRDARDRLLGNYDKHRHICSTNHSQPDMFFRSAQSARRGRNGQNLEYVDLELRPISEPPSVRSVCLSALDINSYKDMSQQVDPIEHAEQMLQTLQAEAKSIQMETIYSGKLVDKCIETEKEIEIKNRPCAQLEILEMQMECNHDEPEYINYDWKCSGLYQLLRQQYDEMRQGKDLLASQQSMKLIKQEKNPNEDDNDYENMQDASATQYTQKEVKTRELDQENLNPDKLDIYNEMEVQYMATLLKKKAQSYNQKEILLEIHSKAMKTLEVLNSNLVAGDISIDNIFNFYKEPQRENIIRLLLRCKKMYEARLDVKKIILLLITQQELFNDIEILRELQVKKYRQSDLNTFNNGIQILQKLQRELNIFRQDHKIFKAKFIYNNKDQYNQIPEAIQDLQQFLSSIKAIPKIEQGQEQQFQNQNNKNQLVRLSSSSANLRQQMNPIAFKETFKVYEEFDKSSMMSESKDGADCTQKLSQLGGDYKEQYDSYKKNNDYDIEINQISQQIDNGNLDIQNDLSNIQTPKVKINYNNNNFDDFEQQLNNKLINTQLHQQESHSIIASQDQLVGYKQQQVFINSLECSQATANTLKNHHNIHQSQQLLEIKQQQNQHQQNSNIISSRTSQLTRYVQNNRYNDDIIQEEIKLNNVNYKSDYASQYNDEEYNNNNNNNLNDDFNNIDQQSIHTQKQWNVAQDIIEQPHIINTQTDEDYSQINNNSQPDIIL